MEFGEFSQEEDAVMLQGDSFHVPAIHALRRLCRHRRRCGAQRGVGGGRRAAPHDREAPAALRTCVTSSASSNGEGRSRPRQTACQKALPRSRHAGVE